MSDSASEQNASGGFWKKLKSGLGKTRGKLAEGVGNLLLGEREIDEEVLDELETSLLLTDVGIDTTREIMDKLRSRVRRKELNNTRALYDALGTLLKELLQPLARPWHVDPEKKPFVVFFVGVNGVGKTTTIGKLAKFLQSDGKRVMLAAGDTFRAAAVEQLQRWGERNDVVVVAQQQGSDSASVVYDAVQAAQARDIDVVLADTAGRLQAKTNLMQELEKIKRVVARLDPEAPHEVLLVLDAGVGQNALSQVREFDAAVGVTGLVLTKLDGTAKAGVLFAIAQQEKKVQQEKRVQQEKKAQQEKERQKGKQGKQAQDAGKPVYFIGVGEGIDDLQPFQPDEFVDALLPSLDDEGNAGAGA